MSTSMVGRALEEETVTTLSVMFLGIEEGPLSGGMAEEIRQPM